MLGKAGLSFDVNKMKHDSITKGAHEREPERLMYAKSDPKEQSKANVC